MAPSPYAPGSLPEYLAGRGRDRDLTHAKLSRLSMFGRSGCSWILIHDFIVDQGGDEMYR